MLIGLLILRLPLLTGLGTFVHPGPEWLLPAFEGGTYILTALLLVWERDRLALFHVDGWALAIYVGAPLLALVNREFFLLSRVQVGCVAFLLLAFIVTRPKLPNMRSHTVIWIGVGVGIALGLFNALCLQWRAGAALRPALDLSILPGQILIQTTRAAAFEEPLFRAFLWGYLKLAGWKDRPIWLLQAALFWLGHLYYFAGNPISFWVVVPTGGLVIGWVAWRTRSMGASMLTHGLGNAIGILGNFHW
ncbi:MAG TPA: CPBP family intramembrane glutamic endopeptidase [Symbiobacteriaceae bacterium]|nr:CPBP family intramembrane glutamic endopeptidase [Symbiobacteriaceae bacterium]